MSVRCAAIVVGSALLLAAESTAGQLSTMPLTSGDATRGGPRISGRNVVWWEQSGASSTREIVFYDGATSVPLTDNEFYDTDPSIHGSRVAWWSITGADAASREIYYFDGQSTAPLTTNGYRDEAPVVSAANVVWWGEPGGNGLSRELYRFDGQTTTPLTNNSVFDGQQHAAGDAIVWRSGSVPNAEIKMFDGATATTIGSSPSTTLEDPNTNGALTAWEGFVGTTVNDREIFLYDGDGADNISMNAFPDFDPQVGHGAVFWWGGVFRDFQVFRHNLADGVTAPISTGELNQHVRASGSRAVWQGKETLADNFEILFWDGDAVVPITESDVDNTEPAIYGARVVWLADGQVQWAQVGQSGDANLDGVVDIFDVAVVSANWGGANPDADVSYDLAIDIFDVAVISANWSPAAVRAAPEPATWALLWLGAATAWIGSRRRFGASA